MDKRGFTLIELLITVAIIGILAGVAVTSYVGATKKAARTEAYTQLEGLRLLEERYRVENANVYTPSAVYNATTKTIPNFLPAFQPGNDINFNYAITQNVQLTLPVAVPFAGATSALTPCFVATATGITNTRVCPNGPGANCDVFAIDCNNNKNY